MAKRKSFYVSVHVLYSTKIKTKLIYSIFMEPTAAKMDTKASTHLDVLEFFSGIGGMRLGLQGALNALPDVSAANLGSFAAVFYICSG